MKNGTDTAKQIDAALKTAGAVYRVKLQADRKDTSSGTARMVARVLDGETARNTAEQVLGYAATLLNSAGFAANVCGQRGDNRLEIYMSPAARDAALNAW